VQTIDAMGVDAIVVRHSAAGAPHRVAEWSSARVINAGDGCHEHPTQALLDAFTLRRHRGPSLDGCRIAIVGDIRRARLGPGDALPGSRTLAHSLDVHRNTVLAAYTELAVEGWVRTEIAGGTFVVANPPITQPIPISSLPAHRLASSTCYGNSLTDYSFVRMLPLPHNRLQPAASFPHCRPAEKMRR